MKKVILFLVFSLTLSVVIGLAGCGVGPNTTVAWAVSFDSFSF